MSKKILCFVLVLMSVSAKSQKLVSAKGRITDAKSDAIANASIHVLNTNVVTLSDAQGDFTLKNIFPGSYIVEVSAVGYATVNKEISVHENGNESLVIQLSEIYKQLDAVTVTAEKKEESLQQVPISITSISSRQVQQYRLWNTKEITAIVPNLYSNNSGDERNVTSIRGITTTSYDPAVATYIDGVNQFSLDTYIPQLFDVERIEVLRGPQGTLYGRNAMGGVINIITKQPTNSTDGFVQLDFGNYNQQRYSGGIRTPLVKDKLFLGASALFSSRDGFYTNEFYNNSFDKQQSISGNYYLKYIPSTKWAFTVNVKHQNNRNNGPFPLAYPPDALDNPFKLSQNAVAKMIDNTLNASLVVNHVGRGFNVTSQTAWQNNYRYYNAPLDGDFSPIDAVTIINDYGKDWNNVKVVTEELRFTSPSNATSLLKWTTGAYFFHQNNPTKSATHFGEDAGLIGVPDSNFSTINISKAKNTGIAFYGQINYSINKKLDLIAGLRYDYQNNKLTVRGEYEKEGIGNFVTQPDTSASAHFSAVSPKAGLSYHPTENNNLFATYSRGYRTGGLTQLSSDPSQPPLYPFKPEYSNNIEAGIKNNFLQDRLRVNVTAFLTLVTDAQVPTLILPAAITVTKNTGKLTSKGVELEASSMPVNGLQIDYNFGYTDARYKSLKVSSNGESVDLAGKRQIFTPDVTSMLALLYSYSFKSKQQLKLLVRGEWFYLGTEYFDLANSIKQSPYSLFNARVGVSSKHVDLFLWGRNLSDEHYIAYAYDFGAIHLGDPKTYGVTMMAKF